MAEAYTQNLTEWPPGTVRIETLQRERGENVVLQPPPTDNPNDPLNWPQWRKHVNFGLSSFYALMVFALIDAATPTWAPMNEQLGFSYTILNDSYALGSGTLAIGAFLLIPFALKYGRRPIYIVSTAVQLGVSVWSARIETVADIMLVNAFGCGIGALAEVICNMTIADVYFIHQRGRMTSIYVWMQNVGGTMAPVAAGYITTSQGWRWTWWWCAIFFGVTFIAFVFLYEESKFDSMGPERSIPLNSVQFSDQPAQQRSQFTETKTADAKTAEPTTVALTASGINSDDGSPRVMRDQRVNHINHAIPTKTYIQKLSLITKSPGSFSKFARHSWQPFMVLFTIPAVFYMSLVYGVMLVWSTVMVTVLSSWMALPPYNFDAAAIGLMSLPAFIGTTLGTLAVGPISDWWILFLSRRNKGKYEPEMRLWCIIPFIPFVPAGAFMFGFGLAEGAAWPIVAVGYALCTFGTAPISSVALTYITDSYTEMVADSLVAVTFTRNVFSTIFVFVITPWIAKVGMKNVFITINILGTVVLLFTFLFIYSGKRFRVHTAARYRWFTERQFEARRI